MEQAEVLVKARIRWSNGVLFRDPIESDKDYVRFGLEVGELGSVHRLDPLLDGKRLVRPVGLEDRIL